MSRRARTASILIGLAVALLGAQSASADNPTLYVHYTMTCTFTIVGDNGGTISVIPPGSYQILVSSPEAFAEPDLSGVADPNFACGGALSFRLTGPGVNLHTTLEDGDGLSDLLQATFQTGTYVAQEDRRPTARLTITVASGASSTGGGSNGSSSGGSSSAGSTATSTAKSNASASVSVRGTLKGGVSTAGKLTLKLNGKAVSSLKAGRYKVTVLDETSKQGFTIQKVGKPAVKVTGKTFLGRNSVTLTLKAGQWVFYSPKGTKSYFIVVA